MINKDRFTKQLATGQNNFTIFDSAKHADNSVCMAEVFDVCGKATVRMGRQGPPNNYPSKITPDARL